MPAATVQSPEMQPTLLAVTVRRSVIFPRIAQSLATIPRCNAATVERWDMELHAANSPPLMLMPEEMKPLATLPLIMVRLLLEAGAMLTEVLLSIPVVATGRHLPQWVVGKFTVNSSN
jgi:hypothetical protein